MIKQQASVKQIRSCKAKLKSLLDNAQTELQKEPAIHEQIKVQIFQVLLTFEKQFVEDLEKFHNNMNNPKPSEVENTQLLVERLKDCIEGVERATQELDVPFLVVNLHIRKALVLLSHLDQIYCKEDAMTVLPLMLKLATAWQTFFKQPDVLVKQYLEILANVSRTLLSESLSLRGIVPKVTTASTFHFCLTRNQPAEPPIATVTALCASMTQMKIEPEIEPELEPVPNKHILIPSDVVEVLNKLELAGYTAYVKGGYVRDTLLNVTPNDIDLITNCPSEKLTTVLGNHFVKSKFIEDTFVAGNIEITCSRLSLKAVAQNCDLTINAFFADKSGRIYDPLNKIADTDKDFIETIDEPQVTLEADSKRLFRVARNAIHVSKKVPQKIIDCMQNLMPSIHKKLPFKVFIQNITKLFCYGKATLAWDFFDRNKLLNGLLNLDNCDTQAKPELKYFIHTKLQLMDNLFWATGQKTTPYHMLTTLLLPELAGRFDASPKSSIPELVESLLKTVCKREGEYALTEVDQNAFKNSIKGLLNCYFLEYLSHKAHTARQVLPRSELKVAQEFIPQFQERKKQSEQTILSKVQPASTSAKFKSSSL